MPPQAPKALPSDSLVTIAIFAAACHVVAGVALMQTWHLLQPAFNSREQNQMLALMVTLALAGILTGATLLRTLVTAHACWVAYGQALQAHSVSKTEDQTTTPTLGSTQGEAATPEAKKVPEVQTSNPTPRTQRVRWWLGKRESNS